MSERLKHVLRKTILGRTVGVALIEVTIAVVVLGLITATVPPVMVLITKAEFRRDEQRIAESLVRMQMEYMKSALYIYGNATYYEEYPEHDYVVYESVPVPNESYLINVVAQPVDIYPEDPDDPDTIIIHEALPEGQDKGIQEITVEIYHVNLDVEVDTPVLVARNYKVDR